jgi:outer membrane protein insertion porin family
MNTPSESVRSRWPRRLLRIAVVGFILLASLGVGAWLYLRSEKFDRFVARKIEQSAGNYGLRVEVGEFELVWAARTVRLRDLKVYNQQTGQFIASIKEAKLNTSIPNLFALRLQRDVILQQLQLTGVDLNVALDEQGRSNFAGLHQPPKTSERIRVDSSQLVTTLTDSRLVFNDEKHRLATTLEGLQARLEAAPASTDQAPSFKTQLSASGGSFGFDARTTPLQAIKLDGTLSNNGMQFDSLTLNSGLGELSASGRFENWSALRYDLQVETRADLVETLRVFAPEMKLKGNLHAQGQLEGAFAEPLRVAFKGNADASDLELFGTRLRNVNANTARVWIEDKQVNFTAERARADSLQVSSVKLNNAALNAVKGEIKNGRTGVSAQTVTAGRLEWPGGAAQDATVRNVNFALQNQRFTVTGDGSIGGGSASGIEFGRATAQLKADNEAVTASNVQASVLGGTASADAAIQLASNGVTTVKGNFADIPTANLLSLSTVKTDQVPLTGKVKGEADISFVNSAPQRLSGTIRANFDGQGTAAIDALPVNGDVVVLADDGEFNIQQLQLNTDVTRLTASGRLAVRESERSSDLLIGVNTSDASQLLTLAKAIPNAEQYIRDYEPLLTGNLQFNGRLTGKLEEPLIEGDLNASSVGVRDALLGALTGHLSLGPNEFRFQNGLLTASNGGSVKFELATPLNVTSEAAAVNTGRLDAIVDRLELDAVLAALGAPASLDFLAGNVSGEAHLTGLPKNMSGTGRLNLIDGRIANQPAELVQADVRLAGQRVLLEKLEARLMQSSLLATGQLDLEQKNFQVSGQAQQIALARLAEAAELTQVNVAGTADANFNVSGSLDKIEDLQVELTTQGQNINVNGRDTGDLKLTARTNANGRLEAELLTGIFTSTGGKPELVRASLELRQDGRPIVIESDLVDLDLVSVLNVFAPDVASSLAGKLNGQLRITGPTVNERGEVSVNQLRGGLTLNGVELQIEGNPLTVQTPLVVALEGSQVRVTPTKITGQGVDLSLGGQLGWQESAQMNFTLNGTVALANLPSFGADLRLDGAVAINNVRLSGTFDQPNLSGEILLNRIGVASPDAPATIEEGSGRIVLSSDKATLESFRARISDGALEITGETTLAEFRPTEWKYDVKATNVDILYQEVRATVNGTLALTGTPEGQLLSGRVDVTDAEYTGEIDLAGLTAGRSIAPGLTGFSGPGFGRRNPGLPPINLNVKVEARDSLIVRDDEINTIGSASLTVTGPMTDPNLTGRVSAEGGSVRFRGQRYEVTTATLDLLGGGSTPVLNLQAEGNTSGYRVSIGFVGEVDQLDLTLRSEPQLTREEILTLIATGRTESRSVGGENLLYTGVDAAASLFTSEFTRPFERQLGALGINRFQIDPVFRPNTNPAARATIGGQLARGLYYSFATDLASEGDRTALLEYSFSNTFSTIFTYTQGGTASGRGINNNNDFALEIRGRKRFSLGFISGPDPKLASTDPNGTAPPPAVRPKLPGANITVTPVPDLKLSNRTLDELLPIKTQGFSRSLARLGERRLLNYLQEKGYFFAEVGWRCEPADCSGDELGVLYDVQPGERYKLQDVRFEGTEQLNFDQMAGNLQSQPANALAGVPFIRTLPFIGGLTRGITSNERVRGDAEALRRNLVDRGYRDARVNSRYAVTEDNGLIVVFNVEEGAQSFIADVVVKGNTLLTADTLREVVPLKGGEVFSYSQAATGTQAIRQLYTQRGFLEAGAELEVVELDDNRVQLVYNVNEGVQAITGGIEITGTTKTKLNWVRRYYDFRKGEVLTPDQIRRTQQDLYATGAFREVGLRADLINSTTGEHDLTLNLTETKPLLFVYGIGYSTDDGARGLIELSNHNIAGTLDSLTLRLRASRREQFSQILFTDLRPFGTKLPTTASVFYSRNNNLRPNVQRRVIETSEDGSQRVINNPDSTAFGLNRFAAFIQSERKLGSRTSLRMRYNFERANLFNFEQNFPETEVTRNEGTVRLGIFSVGISRDTRDNLLNPKRGQLISADHSLATVALGGNESYNKFFGTYQRYHTLSPETPLLKDSTLAFSARIGLAGNFANADRNGDGVISESERRLPISERFFSGGATTLRGFRFEAAGPQGVLESRGSRPDPNDPTKTLFELPTLVPLGGDALTIFNLELRYPLTRRVRMIPFYDAGNVFSRVRDWNWAGMTNTVGLGLHINTPLGPIGVDYGFLLDPPSFRTASGAILRQPRGTLHIRFGQTF